MSTLCLLSAAAAGAATLVYFGLFRSHELLVATIDEITRLKAELKAAKKEFCDSAKKESKYTCEYPVHVHFLQVGYPVTLFCMSCTCMCVYMSRF